MTASKSAKTAAPRNTARTAKTRVARDVGAAYQGSKIEEPVIDTAQPDDAQSFFASVFPSSRRVLGATVLAFCTYAGATYFTMPFVELVSLYATVASGSTFLGLMAWCVGIVLAIWSAAVLGYRAFKFVLDFDAERIAGIGESIKEASTRKVSLVRGWFSRDGQAEHAEAHYAAHPNA